jgi:hypothetical protein
MSDSVYVADAPGDMIEYGTQGDVEAANVGVAAKVSFTHTGGPLGIQFIDGAPSDNALDTQAESPAAPTFRLCPQFCEKCGADTPARIRVNLAGLVQRNCVVENSVYEHKLVGDLNGEYCVELYPGGDATCYWTKTTDVVHKIWGANDFNGEPGPCNGFPKKVVGMGAIFIQVQRITDTTDPENPVDAWQVEFTDGVGWRIFLAIVHSGCLTAGSAANIFTQETGADAAGRHPLAYGGTVTVTPDGC